MVPIMIYHINTIGKQTYIYNMDLLNILNAFNNVPIEPSIESIVEVESVISIEESVNNIISEESVITPIEPSIESTEISVEEKVDKEIIKAVEELKKPKISIIMQSYLGEYSGSRENPIQKYIRAVESFRAQVYKNCELIIVADGCINTFNTYLAKWQDDPSIKIVYADKKGTARMYDKVTEKDKYFRGIPRQMGLEMATGELVTYMDSDDYLLPKFTLNIVSAYNVRPEAVWFINRSWYDNIEADWENETVFESYNRNGAIKIDGLPSKWVPTKLKEKMIIMSPWLLTHKKNCNIKWMDSIGISEDVSFNQRLRKEYKDGIVYENPMYVRCHYSGQWDY